MKKHLALFFLLLCLSFPAGAEIGRLRRLEDKLQKAATPAQKVNALEELKKYHFAFKSPYSVRYAKEAYEIIIAQEEIDYEKLASLLEDLVLINTEFNNHEAAVTHSLELLGIYRTKREKKDLVQLLSNIGKLYLIMDNYEEALKFYFEALDYQQDLKDSVGVPATLNKIGLVMLDEKSYAEAMGYFTEALKESRGFKDKKAEAEALSLIGECFFLSGNYPEAKRHFESAFALRKTIKSPLDLAKSYNEMGKIYEKEGKYTESLEAYFKAYEILHLNKEMESLSDVLNNISHVHYLKNDIQSSLEYQYKALDVAKKHHSKIEQIASYERLVESYVKLNDFEKAYTYEKLVNGLKDSIYTAESQRHIAEMQVKHENSKREKEIDILTKQQKIGELELHKSHLIIYGTITAAFLVLVLAWVLYARNRLQNESNKKLQLQNQIILQKKQEIENQRDAILIKTDNLEKAHDALDKSNKKIKSSISYAQRIQQAVLPSLASIQRNFKDFMVLYLPRDVVSGDFYWCMHRNNQTFIAAVDCTGHGVPGAFMSMIGMALLYQIVKDKGHSDVSEILAEMDKGIKLSLAHYEVDGVCIRDGMDMALCRIDTEEKNIEFAGAKRPLLIIKNGEPELIKGSAHPIGDDIISEQNEYEKHVLPLDPEASYYLFSDGYQDQFGGPEDKKMGLKTLKSLLCDLNGVQMERQKEILAQHLAAWQGSEHQQVDDILIIGFKL